MQTNGFPRLEKYKYLYKSPNLYLPLFELVCIQY